MGHTEREVSIIGHQHQAFGVEIEAPDRFRDGIGRHKVRDDRSSVCVLHRRHDARWLVEQPRPQLRIEGQPYPVDGNHGSGCIDFVAEARDGTVNGHPSSLYQHISVASGGEARPSDQLVESFDDDSGRNGSSSVSTICAGGT